MNIPPPCLLVALALVASAEAQTITPAEPNAFENRPIGSVTPGGVTVIPKEGAKNPKARYITYVVLSTSRIWTSTEGKNIEGKLIAFEDMVVEAPKGDAAPPSPTPPEVPTVIRDGKARLLVNQKPVELATSRLSEADREFIEGVSKAYQKKKAAP